MKQLHLSVLLCAGILLIAGSFVAPNWMISLPVFVTGLLLVAMYENNRFN